jgi:hypothetical protein
VAKIGASLKVVTYNLHVGTVRNLSHNGMLCDQHESNYTKSANAAATLTRKSNRQEVFQNIVLVYLYG